MDSSILTIFASATGGVLLTVLGGFLTTYLNNKHSFKMEKGKDKFEYVQYRNRMLYKYLEKLELECRLTFYKDINKTVEHASKVRDEIRSIYILSVPFLDFNIRKNVHELYIDENRNCIAVFDTGWRNENKNVDGILVDEKVVSKWLDSLTLLREELIGAITNELLEIRDSRMK